MCTIMSLDHEPGKRLLERFGRTSAPKSVVESCSVKLLMLRSALSICGAPNGLSKGLTGSLTHPVDAHDPYL
jgi:hypothetical protein